MKIIRTDEQQYLIDIISAYLNVDLTERSRDTGVVQGRYIYIRIRTEMGDKCTQLGRSLDMHHASILHYRKNFNDYFDGSVELRSKYNEVLTKYNEKYDPMLSLTTRELQREVIRLREKNVTLSSIAAQHEEDIANRKFTTLHNLIDERTTESNEGIMYTKLRAYFNGI